MGWVVTNPLSYIQYSMQAKIKNKKTFIYVTIVKDKKKRLAMSLAPTGNSLVIPYFHNARRLWYRKIRPSSTT